ncbi:MAG: adenylate/guanylate cyclase domain-containing protein [Zoogloea oleivorans]|jgi:adenylate cyclase|uniref:CHASE2 domain-containing protein n=1 Tax=Zoogloea oleivorans TaxID=1552750 RepID=UPI002A35F2A2|nr:adenylate/guanylate cyclase domain-containing protein [Zoogloea oleivorans]MDY0036817.1 adenylate/guanylate cyclase domain-containing protein [Zoogloea oleivorans]
MMSRLPEILLRPAWLRGLALTSAGLIVAVLVLLLPGLHQRLEESSGDPLWRLVAQSATANERRVVVIDIDESSLARVGAWPWPRERIAALSEALQRHGARLQLMDIVFPESRDGDQGLARAQSLYPLHVGQIFDLSPDGSRVGMLSGVLDGLGCQDGFPVAGGYVGNVAQLARRAGHITPIFDADGAVRRIAPVLCHQQRPYPALALLGLESLTKQPLRLRYEAGLGLFAPHGWLILSEFQMRIPLDADGTTRLSYVLPRHALTAISAADVLEDKVPVGLLEGAIALVGATAFGIGDTVATPLNANVPGVEVHAQFIAGLLDSTLAYTPRAAGLLQFGFAFLSASLLLLSVRQRALHAYGVPLAGALVAGLAYGVHAVLLLQAGWWLGWLAPALFALLAGLALASAEFAIARIERERVYRNLCSYLPEQVAADIALREPVGSIEAERREVTVLFADLRNFSAYCEARSPEEAAGLLHAFFCIANRIVQAHGGIVEEFVGDAIMAIWNAPQACPQHPERAMQAALALVQEVSSILPGQAPPGLEPLALGVGLETGNALVGSFGPVERRTHTAMGETVTVASRLQAMTADLSSPIVIGPGAAARLPHANLTSVGSFLLEGLQRPRTLYLPAPGSLPQSDSPALSAPRIRLVV